MVSWATIQSLAIFFGPLLLPKALAYYRSIKNRPQSQIRPLPAKTNFALLVLLSSGLIAFLSTLPLFAPENVFRYTQSRLHTAGGVILTRIAALRPTTPFDEKLRAVFDAGGLEARLLYVRYGPDVLVNNTIGKAGETDSASDFLIYALPGILAPHFAHLFALGVATSGFLSGKEGARWRTVAIISSLLLAAAEGWWLASYDDTANLRSVRVNDIDFVFWKVRVWRGLGIAVVDGILGWIVWLQATGRAFLTIAPAGERIADHAQRLEGVLARVRGVGVVKNGVVRDVGLSRRGDEYWRKENEVMKDVMEQPEVLEAQRNALRTVDTAAVAREAEAFIDRFLGLPIAQN